MARLQADSPYGDNPFSTGDDGKDDKFDPFEALDAADDSFFGDAPWQEWLSDQLGEEWMNAAIAAGTANQGTWGQFTSNFDALVDDIVQNLFNDPAGMESQDERARLYTSTPEGWNRLVAYGRRFYGAINSDLTPFLGAAPPRSGRGSGSSGGSRAPTAEEIRNSYDLDQLSSRANTIKQGLVLEAFDDPRAVARAYVDKIVAGKGQVKIDFDTFVETQVQDTARFKSIYRNKPPGMDPRQYIAPLYQQAAMTAPREAEKRTIAAAQFGASQEEFQSRLNRTSAVTSSSPYINKIQGQVSQLKDILRG